MELMRRRGMMELPSSVPVETWDFEWDYTMGLPENNGMTKTTSGSNTVTLEANGVKVKNGSTSSYVRWDAPTASCTTGVIEAKFLVHPSTGNYNNFRMCISNGTNGGGTATPKNNLCIMDSNSVANYTVVSSYTHDVFHTERIVLRDNVFDVYLDGNLVVSNSPVSNIVYTTGNRVFIQSMTSSNYAIVQSIKFKFNRIV